MHADYADIIERAGKPDWWDEHGTPRYGPFQPDRVPNIYADVAALYVVRCVSCGRTMRVAMHSDLSERVLTRLRQDDNAEDARARPGPRDFWYGDPPRHDCPGAGETMVCDEVAVLEWWERDSGDWVRRPEHQVLLDDGSEGGAATEGGAHG